MKIGIAMFVTDYSIAPGELARAAEERGFESLWVPEHTHIPTSRKSPWGGGRILPEVYKQTLDPFMTLTAAAMTTSRIKLATGICLVVERDPIHTAKEVATIDYLSGGRFLFGIGGGWNAEEMANHGTNFKARFALMRERIEAMRVIWTCDVAEYRGTDILAALLDYQQLVAAAGRNYHDLPMSVFAPPQDADLLKRYRDAGIHRFVLLLHTAAREGALEKLDACAALLA